MEMILENLPMALCVLLGMGPILVEVFLPGFGLPGISGIALVGVGTIMAAMHFGTLTAVALLLVIIAVLAVLVSWLLLCLLALSASAVGPVEVGVAFWKDSKGEQTSLANDGIDTDRAATLTRQANGTYTLELPLKKLSRINITGRLSGLTIGDVTYDGTLSGSFDDDTALLTIKNLPASVLTGSDAGKALAVTCNLDMDVKLLGEITTPARLCIWAEK